MENPIKMGWFGGKPTIFGNIHINHSSLTCSFGTFWGHWRWTSQWLELDGETWPDDPMLDMGVDDYSFTLEVGRLYGFLITGWMEKTSRCWSPKFIFSAIKSFMNKLYVILSTVFGWDWFLIFVLAYVTTLICFFLSVAKFWQSCVNWHYFLALWL